MHTRLDGKAAIITGAASGIGLATARLLADAGALVLAADIDDVSLSAFEGMPGIITRQTDMADAESVTDMVDAAIKAFGTVDILINNAGIMDVYQGVASLDLDLWRRVFAVNVDGPMHAMRRTVPIMLARGSGVIVNVVSVAGVRGAAAGAAYTASKHALLGLSRSTAWTYADRGIRCNAVLPGATKTNVRRSMLGTVDTEAETRMRIYQRCIPQELEPEDIAQLVLWMSSDASRRINGAEIAADGGWLTA